MKNAGLVALIVTLTAYPVAAKPHRIYQHHYSANRSNEIGAHMNITCEMVRNYVAQVGLEQARAMATAAGMTAADERRARQCLEKKV